jgi:hypothetical protein
MGPTGPFPTELSGNRGQDRRQPGIAARTEGGFEARQDTAPYPRDGRPAGSQYNADQGLGGRHHFPDLDRRHSGRIQGVHQIRRALRRNQ